MSWTYDPSSLADSARDQVRMEIGDVDPNADVTLLDEEIAHAVAVEADVLAASARCAELIGRRYSLKADVQVGELRITYSRMATQYQTLATGLRGKSLGTVLPYVGGRKLSEKETLAADDSAVQPLFTKTRGRNPRAGGPSPGLVLDTGEA